MSRVHAKDSSPQCPCPVPRAPRLVQMPSGGRCPHHRRRCCPVLFSTPVRRRRKGPQEEPSCESSRQVWCQRLHHGATQPCLLLSAAGLVADSLCSHLFPSSDGSRLREGPGPTGQSWRLTPSSWLHQGCDPARMAGGKKEESRAPAPEGCPGCRPGLRPASRHPHGPDRQPVSGTGSWMYQAWVWHGVPLRAR